MVKLEIHPDIIINSQVSLARNIESYPFPEWAGSKQLEELKKNSRVLAKSLDLKYFSFEKLNNTQKGMLAEQNLVSNQFIRHEGNHKAVLINKKNNLSIMVNEEDHLHIQSIKNNLDLDLAFKEVDKADDIISSSVQYAFCKNLGYYTACPTNLGTGLRASITMHLPAVVLTQRIYELVKTLNEKGISVRGMFGDGTVAFGNTFQITNQSTLGLTEEDIIGSLINSSQVVAKMEMNCRKNLLKRDKIILEDKVMRSVGVLKHSVILSLEEAFELLSTIKLGICLELLKGKSKLKKLNSLSTQIQRAHMCQAAKKELSDMDEKKMRAKMIREELKL